MKPYEIQEKLRNFELAFPDKSSIELRAAKEYLQGVVGRNIDDDYIRSFIEMLGYKQIEIKTEPEEDELDLDEIINLEWSPKETPKTSRGSHMSNTVLLSEYHDSEEMKAFEQLVVDNMKLVQKVASRYVNYVNHQLSFDDLVSEGTIGLIKAIRKFDVKKDVQFSTYAVWWIRQKIIRAITDTGTTVRIPVHMFDTVVRIKRKEMKYLLEDQKPNVDEICRELNISVGTYEKAKLVEHRFLAISSIDQHVSNEEQDTEIADFLSIESHHVLGEYNEMYLSPSLLAERGDIRSRIIKAVGDLKPKEQVVILERFGFLDNEPKTLEQLGQKFKLTRERIRQIEARALGRLRNKMAQRTIREDYEWPEQLIGG